MAGTSPAMTAEAQAEAKIAVALKQPQPYPRLPNSGYHRLTSFI
jgi:hypothetical protein